MQVEGMMTGPTKDFEYSCIALIRLSPPEDKKNDLSVFTLSTQLNVHRTEPRNVSQLIVFA